MRSEIPNDFEVELMHQNPNGIWLNKGTSTPVGSWKKVIGTKLVTLLVHE